MRKLLLVLLLLLIPAQAFSATYYVAQTAAGDADGSSYANRMSVSTHNGMTFSGDDVIYLCDTIISKITPPSSGTSGHVITYRGDLTDHTALIQPSSMSLRGAAIDLYGRSYITLYNETTQASIDGQITSGTVDTLFVAGHDNHDLVSVSTATNITIDNWKIMRGYSGIRSTGASNITITRCEFEANRMRGVALSSNCQNITIGGSAENANEFDRNTYKTDYGGNYIGAELYFYQVVGLVISYNNIHGTVGTNRADGWSMIGMAIYGVRDFVIEYNTVHNMGGKNFRGAIHLKGLDATWRNYDGVIRYNNIYNLPIDPNWVYAASGAISLTRDTYNIRLYGNRIHSAYSAIDLDINGESAITDGANGYHIQDVHIWANSISDIYASIFSTADGYSANTDDYDDIYFVNNSCASSLNQTTVYETASPFYSRFHYAASTDGTDDTGSNPHIHLVNNILYEGRYGQETKYGLGVFLETTNDDWLELDYNLGFDSADLGNYSIKWGSTVYDYDSASLPAAWTANDPIPGNPLFTDVSTGDLRLGAGSPAIDTGDDLTAVSIANITVEHYSGSALTFTFDTILDPTTDWSTIPPTIVTALQSEQTAPVIGAYAYAAGGEDVTAPTLLQGSVVDSTETTLSLTLSESCSGNTGFTITASGGAATLTYSSGDGADRTYAISRAIAYGETITLSYTAGDVADLATNALATIVDEPVINTVPAPGGSGVYRNRISNPTINQVALATCNQIVAVAPDTTAPAVSISTSDPQEIEADILEITFTCTDAVGVTQAKWRVGAAPDVGYGTVVAGSSPFTATTSGYVEGDETQTIYAGCRDTAGNWGSDSIGVSWPSAAECLASPYWSVSSSGSLHEALGSSYLNVYVGWRIAAEQTSYDVCNVRAYLTATGTVSGYSYTAKIYSLDGSGNLATLQGTSAAVTGVNAWSDTAVDFSFDPPVTAAATYAIVITRGNDNASNYISVFYRTGNNDSGYSNLARWRDTGALVSSYDADAIGTIRNFGTAP